MKKDEWEWEIPIWREADIGSTTTKPPENTTPNHHHNNHSHPPLKTTLSQPHQPTIAITTPTLYQKQPPSQQPRTPINISATSPNKKENRSRERENTIEGCTVDHDVDQITEREPDGEGKRKHTHHHHKREINIDLEWKRSMMARSVSLSLNLLYLLFSLLIWLLYGLLLHLIFFREIILCGSWVHFEVWRKMEKSDVTCSYWWV